MSDIDIVLSGIIALFVFLASAGLLGIFGVISLVITFGKASKAGEGIKQQRTFAYFLAAVLLIVLNLIAFGILAYLIDSNARETNEFLDQAAVYAWLPLQPIAWILLGMIINKRKK